MENQVMNYEEAMDNEVETYEMEPEGSGLSTAVAMLIGAGLTAASVAAVKLGKKLYAKIKAKKESEVEADEHDFVEITDEEIKKVTK